MLTMQIPVLVISESPSLDLLDCLSWDRGRGYSSSMMTIGFSESTVPSCACTENFPGTEESM